MKWMDMSIEELKDQLQNSKEGRALNDQEKLNAVIQKYISNIGDIEALNERNEE